MRANALYRTTCVCAWSDSVRTQVRCAGIDSENTERLPAGTCTRAHCTAACAQFFFRCHVLIFSKRPCSLVALLLFIDHVRAVLSAHASRCWRVRPRQWTWHKKGLFSCLRPLRRTTSSCVGVGDYCRLLPVVDWQPRFALNLPCPSEASR
jgi:hypothetical protein